MIVYGIKNCDTVKKFLKELDAKKIKYEFYDYKKTPPSKELLQRWKKELSDFPINAKGRTFIQIKEEFENASTNKQIELLIQNSSALKRPLTEYKGNIILGFDKDFLEKL